MCGTQHNKDPCERLCGHLDVQVSTDLADMFIYESRNVPKLKPSPLFVAPGDSRKRRMRGTLAAKQRATGTSCMAPSTGDLSQPSSFIVHCLRFKGDSVQARCFTYSVRAIKNDNQHFHLNVN